MIGCRISRVTCRATGRSLHILPTQEPTEIQATFTEAMQMARDYECNQVAIVLANEQGEVFSIAQYPECPAPAALVGGLQWLGMRIIKESGGLDD